MITCQCHVRIVVLLVIFLFFILSLDLIFVTVGKSVNFGVVEQALVAISPRKWFVADAEVLVWHEFRSGKRRQRCAFFTEFKRTKKLCIAQAERYVCVDS